MQAKPFSWLLNRSGHMCIKKRVFHINSALYDNHNYSYIHYFLIHLVICLPTQLHIICYSLMYDSQWFMCFSLLYPRKQSLGVYRNPHVRPFVRPSLPPSQSLIRYSSKTATKNFMKLPGIVNYMMPYCTSYFKIFSNDFGVSESKTRTLPY